VVPSTLCTPAPAIVNLRPAAAQTVPSSAGPDLALGLALGLGLGLPLVIGLGIATYFKMRRTLIGSKERDAVMDF
jgi:hypothetical protein